MKKDFLYYDWFFQGIRHDFPLCCIFFFMTEINRKVKFENNSWYKSNDGYIRCLDCIMRDMKK
jgi:hypothetical protein